MKRQKKIVLIIFAGTAGILIIAAFLAIILFPGEKLRKIAEEGASKAVHMPVTLGKVKLSIFGIPGIRVDTITVGPARPGEPPLARVKSVDVHVNILPLLRGQVEIRSLDVDTPQITLLTRRDKSSNMPVFSDSTQIKTTGPPALPLPITLHSLRIRDGKLAMLNEESNSRVIMEGISQKLSLRLGRDLKNMQSSGNLNIKNLSFAPGAGKKPVSGIILAFSHELRGNAAAGDLSLSRGELELNGLPLNISGKVAGWKSAAFHIEAKKIGADKIADAIPEGVIGPKGAVSAKGSFSFTLDGTVSAGTPKPFYAYTGNLSIENMSLSVKGFPKKIDRFQLVAAFTEKGLTIREMALQVGGSDLNLTGAVSNYLKKPDFNLKTTGKVSLDELADALPVFRKSGLKGGAAFDLSASGTPSLLQSMEMNGSITLNALTFPSSKVLKNPTLMNGALRLSPQNITLENLTVRTGKSDFSLSGKLEGYMNLLPSKNPRPAFLSGALTSRLIDINDMVFIDKNTPMIKPWDMEKPLKNLPVPPTLSVDASVSLNTLVFGRLKADSVKGHLTLKNGNLELSGLDISAYNGILAGKTVINFSNPDNVQYNGAFDLKKLNAQTFISSFFGTGDNFRGLISSSLSFSGAGLDSVSFMNNLKGSGSATVENGQFVNWDFTKKLGQTIRFLNFDTLNFGNAATTFIFGDRKVTTPALLFQTQYGDITISGATGYDTKVNYDIVFKLNAAAANLASQNKFGDLGSLFSPGSVPQLYLTATGTLKSPAFKIDTSRTRKDVQDKLKNEAEKLLNKQNDKIREQGKKILDKLFK
jgi:uncharacterized protein involved in outer membrane biogenesis